jgi:hypothetical protein
VENICTDCRDNYCFRPKDLKAPEFRTQCTKVTDYAEKGVNTPNYFKAEGDNLVDPNTLWVVSARRNVICHCKYSGKYYRVGVWGFNKKYLEFVAGQPACQGENFEVLEISPVGQPIYGSGLASVSCFDRGYCYKCNLPCKNCLGDNTDQCLSCLDNHIEEPHPSGGKWPIGVPRRCILPKPMPTCGLAYSNQIHRLQIQCDVSLAPRDFVKSLKIWMEGGNKGRRRLRRRRLRNLGSHFTQTRSLQVKFDTDDVGHPLNRMSKPKDKADELRTIQIPIRSATLGSTSQE